MSPADPAPAVRSSPTSLVCRSLRVEIDGHCLLDGFDLDAPTGSWTAIIGPNGAGKSTAMRAIAGLIDHDGTVELAGAPLGPMTTRQRARRLAFVPQSPIVPPATSVHDYVLLGRTPHLGVLATESARDHDVVAGVLDRLDLGPLAARALDTLSGGERQRVILARALAQEAPVVLLDEPTTALDLGHQVEVLDLVEELRRTTDLTVVCTMHDLTLAGQYAETLVLLDGGRVVQRGTPDEVLTPRRVTRHYRTDVEVFATPHGPVVVPVRRHPARPGPDAAAATGGSPTEPGG